MAVLKRGDWVLDGDEVGQVIAVELVDKNAIGFTLVDFYDRDADYNRRETIHESELTKLDEALYPILSDSIKRGE